MPSTLREKLSTMITDLHALRSAHADEISALEPHHGSSCEEDLDLATSCLEDALFEIDNPDQEPEEHANSSVANSKDYQAEENATTDRDNQ